MKFLAKLFAGNVALWRTFWLIAIPLAVIWDVSGGCILTGCEIQSLGPRGALFIAGFLVALFTLSNLGIAFVSVAIWRSSSKRRRDVWWERLLAFSAKSYATLTGAAAAVILLVILYGLLHYAVTGQP
jgi:hypothetical protein